MRTIECKDHQEYTRLMNFKLKEWHLYSQLFDENGEPLDVNMSYYFKDENSGLILMKIKELDESIDSDNHFIHTLDYSC